MMITNSKLRKIGLVFLILGFWQISLLPAAESSVIRVDENPTRWTLRTASSATVLVVGNDGTLLTAHEGPPADPFQVAPPKLEVIGKRCFPPITVPTRGAFPLLAPAVEVLFPDGLRDIRLFYHAHEISEQEGVPLLKIELKDELYPLHVSVYFRVFPQFDLIERWLVIENRGPTPLLLENVASSCVMLGYGQYDLVHLTGRWGDEFTPGQVLIKGSAQVLEARGLRFPHALPWYLIRPSGESAEEHGDVWFGSLAWSGNWFLRFEPSQAGELQILGGINFWDTSWRLAPGARFTTPKLITGFCREGLGGASRRMHRYIRRHVLPPAFRDKLRPVLYNSWFVTMFDVNAAQQVEAAKMAKELGVELFAMDDGWFHGRKDDRGGLGDWWPDKDKFPEGLGPMIRAVNEIGMDFGIWVEPEMVNPNSELYRAHPEWAFHRPGSKPLEDRNQLVLNMAREDVKQYTLDWLTKLLTEAPCSFLKWDFNRDVAEIGWPEADPGLAREARIRFVRNVYEIHDEIRRRFPDLMIEACAGGGGRIDLGMLKRVDQVWMADNTNPADRLFIQYGWSYLFPTNIMACWTTDQDWRGAKPSLEYRFRAAMHGALGIGNDLRKWGPEEIKIAKSQIALYKLIRPIVQRGDLYRLISPFESNRTALEYVAENRSAAVVFMYNTVDALAPRRLALSDTRSSPRGPNLLKLRGLDSTATYVLDLDGEGRASGQTLMNRGVPWLPQNDYQAKIIRLQRVSPSSR